MEFFLPKPICEASGLVLATHPFLLRTADRLELNSNVSAIGSSSVPTEKFEVVATQSN